MVLSRSQECCCRRAITSSHVVSVKKKKEKLCGHFYVYVGFVLRCQTEWQTEDDQKFVCLYVLKCSKQSISRNRQMTGPFMIVGTEASIHDCAVVMRRRADVSAYEYDIVLSVPWISETSLYWLWCLDSENQVRSEKNGNAMFLFWKGHRVHISMGDGAITSHH